MSDIETILKLSYTNIDQFVQDVNRNFAVIENSPLYKGVPGNPGTPGNPGSVGVRGTSFLFVDYLKFVKEFPNELTIGSDINLSYINSKLTNQSEREKLFNALNVTSFVDKDIVVLTDSSMVSFNEVSDMFTNTGLAFNADTNLEANINTIIENYVKSYIDQNEIINSLANVFSSYTTYGKNYSDKNSSNLTNQLLNSSVYSPFISGFNNQNGILIDNHKYYGYSDQYFPLSNNGSFIFGSTKRYYQLLMDTISNDTNQSLSSDYSPGVNNIPSLIVLQDTTNNGILIGYKGKNNLKRFGSIYKNSSDDLVIKSDSGKLVSEYAELRINRQYLKFDKLVQFGDTLEVSRNLSVFGEINQTHLRSGLYTTTQSANLLEIGIRSNNSEINVVSNDVYFSSFVDKVLVTGQNGKLSKSYQIEKSILNNNEVIGFAQITNIPNSPNNILTSNYYYHLATKINNITTYVNTNYWTKKNFEDNVIPTLILNDTLRVNKKLYVGSNSFDSTTGVISLVGNDFVVGNSRVSFSNYSSKVLITNSNGLIENKWILSYANPFSFNSTTGKLLLSLREDKYEIANYDNLYEIGNTLSNIVTWIGNSYWDKNQWSTGVIPNLTLSNTIKAKNIDITNHILTTNQSLSLGYGVNYDVSIDANTVRFSKFASKVLVTNSNGTLIQSHNISTTSYTSSYSPSENSLTVIPILSQISNINKRDSDVILDSQLTGIKTYVDNTIKWVNDTYWRKGHFDTNSIPSLRLNTFLSVSGNAVLGGTNLGDNANIIVNGSSTIIGKTSTGVSIVSTTTIQGDILKFTNLNSKVLVTNSVGTVEKNYEVATSLPTSSDNSGVTDWLDHATIKLKFWTKGVAQNFVNYPTLATQFLTAKYLDWIVGNFKAIREMLYDRPTYSELNNMSPIGMIIMWDASLIDNIPDNFVICDGRPIPGTNKNTRNMIGKTVKFVNSNPGNYSGNNNNVIKLSLDQLPTHRMYGWTQSSGEHSHQMFSNGPRTDDNATSMYDLLLANGGRGTVSWSYEMKKDMRSNAQLLSPTIGRTSSNGAHSHYFESNEIGQGLDINIEPASIGVIPVMRYK